MALACRRDGCDGVRSLDDLGSKRTSPPGERRWNASVDHLRPRAGGAAGFGVVANGCACAGAFIW
jgi:hypothetical protein